MFLLSVRTRRRFILRPKIQRYWRRWGLVLGILLYCVLRSYFWQPASTTHSNHSNVDNEVPAPRSWPRIIKDQSIACRQYLVPLKAGIEIGHSLQKQLDCRSDANVWVEMDGPTAYVTKRNPNVICKFQGMYVHIQYVTSRFLSHTFVTSYNTLVSGTCIPSTLSSTVEQDNFQSYVMKLTSDLMPNDLLLPLI